jgi:hypothetical protein
MEIDMKNYWIEGRGGSRRGPHFEGKSEGASGIEEE